MSDEPATAKAIRQGFRSVCRMILSLKESVDTLRQALVIHNELLSQHEARLTAIETDDAYHTSVDWRSPN